MKSVRVSNAAQAELEAGYRISVSEWGVGHADAYFSELRAAIMRLGETPKAWPFVNDLSLGLRRMIWRSHAVYYRETGAQVEVLAILHGRQDAASVLKTRA